MDPIFLVILVVIAIVIGLVWRRRAEPTSPEEALEQAALKAEQDQHRTSAIEAADRYNVNGPPNP